MPGIVILSRAEALSPQVDEVTTSVATMVIARKDMCIFQLASLQVQRRAMGDGSHASLQSYRARLQTRKTTQLIGMQWAA
jgi:hypothetical protein